MLSDGGEAGGGGKFALPMPTDGVNGGVLGDGSAHLSQLVNRDTSQFDASYGNSFNGMASFPTPDVPTASFGLSLGSFLPDSSKV